MTPLESWATVVAIAGAMVALSYAMNRLPGWLKYQWEHTQWLRLEHWRRGRRF